MCNENMLITITKVSDDITNVIKKGNYKKYEVTIVLILALITEFEYQVVHDFNRAEELYEHIVKEHKKLSLDT